MLALSEACERNKDPILAVLRSEFADRRGVLRRAPDDDLLGDGAPVHHDGQVSVRSGHRNFRGSGYFRQSTFRIGYGSYEH